MLGNRCREGVKDVPPSLVQDRTRAPAFGEPMVLGSQPFWHVAAR